MALLFAVTGQSVHAHESLPIVVSLTEGAPGEFTVRTRLPGNVAREQAPRISPGEPCRATQRTAVAVILSCSRDQRPEILGLQWPGGVPASALLVRSRFLDGTNYSEVQPPGSTALSLPQAKSPWQVTTSYVRMGAEHIAFGIDHLLFLVLLIMVSGTARRTVATVTGFTVGHAITITLASLGIVKFNAAMVEALVALSIVFVAVELVRARRDTLLMRRPFIIATGFGTLHGLGFASALAEIGLEQNYVVLSLIGFNIGVELGQLVFVALVFAVVTIVPRHFNKPGFPDCTPRIRMPFAGPGTGPKTMLVAAIGVVASFWFWERSLVIFT